MADELEFGPVFEESYTSEDAIEGRMGEDVNQGVEEGDENWVDTRVGAAYQVVLGPTIKEIARLWDALSVEVPSAAFPTRAWGDFLDEWIAAFGKERNDAVKATGEVTFKGEAGALIPAGARVSAVQTDPEVDPPEFITTDSGGVIPESGEYTAPIEAVEAGAEGNVSKGAITLLLDSLEGVDSVTNEEATLSGADEEDDEELRKRVELEFQGTGAGNIADYERWALEVASIGIVTVIPIADGPGTVTVVILDSNGDPVSEDIVDALQAILDPLPGQGAGLAPIDHTVSVVTGEQVAIAVESELEFDTGFTLDGEGGTVALRETIVAALSEYINELGAGEDVIYDRVKAAIYSVEGVYKVKTLEVNSGEADIELTSSPAQTASLTLPPTLTE